jgi:uncharacterized membrane protein
MLFQTIINYINGCILYHQNKVRNNRKDTTEQSYRFILKCIVRSSTLNLVDLNMSASGVD